MLKVMQQRQGMHTDQNGIVAIFTVLIIMGVLTLLTLGFSNITRQAQKRTLDDQLSTQAFYAAETGINRAWDLLNTGALTVDKTECRNTIGSLDFGYDVDNDLGISINCLLVDTTPSSVRIDSVPVGQAKTFPFEVPSTTNTLTFHWDNAGDYSGTVANESVFLNNMPRLPSAHAWGSRIGMLRIDLIPIAADMTTMLQRDELVNHSYSFILYPGGSSGTDNHQVIHTIGTDSASKGIVLGRYCEGNDPEYLCSATVRLGGRTSNAYYIRVQSYYNPTSLKLEALDGSGNRQEFRNTQAVIDATGRVQDVSRRLQVNVPILTERNRFPGYHESFSILSASSLCKRIIGVPNASTVDLSDAQSDPACNIAD